YRELGVDVFLGRARFTSPRTVDVDGKTLRFRKAVIATGARAARPTIPGLAESRFLTNETVFSLTQLPPHLAVIGAGPIGCELAQVFARFGSQVFLLEGRSQILPREDRDAAARVQKSIQSDGVELVLECKIRDVHTEGREKVIRLDKDCPDLRVDEILVGVGRVPNVDGLNLEAAGVQYDKRKGVLVNDRLQTTNRSVYAAGDICFPLKFTHTADATARIAIRNALFRGRAKASALTIPWCTYTDPEIAHVGMYERDMKEKGIPFDTFVQEFKDVDRAVLDGETEGFVKVHVRKGTDRILGATIVAPHAGDMISELTLAIVGKLGLRTIADTIHPYPTQAEAIKKIADTYNRTRLKPWIKGLFKKWLVLTR
ncbi:MAG: mercuric reductase, partial [Thermoguttaceae bacterium]